LIRGEFVKLQAERKVIEIVSGLAPGPDRLGIDIAKEFKLPWAEFPADWDSEPRRAGFIRNGEMAEYASRGLIIWDGRSSGTAHMLEQLKKRSIPYTLINFSE
jgi:hypothetical protein